MQKILRNFCVVDRQVLGAGKGRSRSLFEPQIKADKKRMTQITAKAKQKQNGEPGTGNKSRRKSKKQVQKTKALDYR